MTKWQPLLFLQCWCGGLITQILFTVTVQHGACHITIPYSCLPSAKEMYWIAGAAEMPATLQKHMPAGASKWFMFLNISVWNSHMLLRNIGNSLLFRELLFSIHVRFENPLVEDQTRLEISNLSQWTFHHLQFSSNLQRLSFIYRSLSPMPQVSYPFIEFLILYIVLSF